MRRISVGLAVVLTASPTLAQAAGERAQSVLTLDYVRSYAAASCPGPDVLREQIAQRLRYDLVAAEAPEHLRLNVDRRNDRYRVAGELRDQGGRVVYTPETTDEPNCVEAVKNMAILSAAHYTSAHQGWPTPAPPTPAPAAAQPPTPPSPAPPPPTSPLRLQFGVATTVAFALAPAVVVVGPSWLIGARASHVSFELEGRALFAPSIQLGGMSIVPSIVTGSAAACLHAGALFGCGRLELGTLHFASTTDLRIDPPSPLLFGFGARAGAEWLITQRFFLRGYADLLTLATPVQFWRTQDRQLLWSSFPVSPSVGVGIGASF